MKRNIFTLLILIIITISWAEPNHNLGIALGAASGSGFSYRHYNDTIGYQINVVLIGSKEQFYIPLGAKVMRPFHETSFSKAYYFAASSVLFDLGTESEQNHIVSVGCGVGMEFTVKGNLHFSLDLPFTVIDIFKTSSEDLSIYFPIPEIGLYYNF